MKTTNIKRIMKPLKWGSLALLSGVLVFTSCSSDDEQGSDVNGSGISLTFRSTIGSNSNLTKAISSSAVEGKSYDQLKAYWENGDKMTIMLDNEGSYTFSEATVTPNADDNTTATVNAKIDAGAKNGNTIYAFYPVVSTDGSEYTFNYTLQDGTLAGVAKLDPRMGTAQINVGDGQATLSGTLNLTTPVKFNDSDEGFGSCYFGVKVTDPNNEAVTVKNLSIAPVNPTENGGWVNLIKVTPKEKKYEQTSTYYSDPITVTLETASAERFYVAYPSANSGQTIRFTATAEDGKVYTTTKTFNGKAGNYYPVTLKMNEVQDIEYVDMGTDVDWGDRNIGASDPEDYGDYFAWGETKSKTLYSWTNYKFGDIGQYGTTEPSKYNSTDKKTVLDSEDDAATTILGEGYRIPTLKDLNDLIAACGKPTKDVENGVVGLKFTSTKTGNSIFFPTTGYMYNSLVQNGDVYFSVSTLYSGYGESYFGMSDSYYSLNLTATHDAQWSTGHGTLRSYGLTVRPVKVKSSSTTTE